MALLQRCLRDFVLNNVVQFQNFLVLKKLLFQACIVEIGVWSPN